jgi:D-alanyl-D-alanine carboxypeptidase
MNVIYALSIGRKPCGGYKSYMLKRISAFLCLVLFAASLHAATASETAALRLFKQWLDAFNSADRARITAFWQKYGNQNTEEHVAKDIRLRSMTGGMSISHVEEATETHVLVLMKENHGGWSLSTMDLASTDPVVVAKIGGSPVPPPQGAIAPAAGDRELAARLDQHMKEMTGPVAYSGAALIAHNGQIVVENAWGAADSRRQIPNTVNTQFCIGSMNKMFTAVAVLQLVQQGSLVLDKPIATWMPDYPNHDLAARVTIRQLLSHTGGTGDIFTPEYLAHRQQIRTLADYVRLFGNRPVAFEPGTRMEYSNYGFILLGRIIELVSGEAYQDYVHKHIFLPAAMLHTDARPEADHPSGRAIGYTRTASGLAPNTDTMPWSGTSAGGGYSTVHDLFLFAQALEAGTLLRTDLLKEATQPSLKGGDYGLGFYVLPDGGYGHGGGAPGINGELHILSRRGYVIVALANRDPRMATNLVDFITATLPPSSATVGN